jgi:hypothetical protein
VVCVHVGIILTLSASVSRLYIPVFCFFPHGRREFIETNLIRVWRCGICSLCYTVCSLVSGRAGVSALYHMSVVTLQHSRLFDLVCVSETCLVPTSTS